MTKASALRIAVFPGDGIGPEVMSPCIDLLGAVTGRLSGPELTFQSLEAGAQCYRDTGDALPAESLEAARRADAILLAAAGLPSIRYPDGTEIAPQIDLRMELGLYAGVRPVRQVAGLPTVLADERAAMLDFVLIRESTEGLFASFRKGVREADRATEQLVITREVCERLFDFSYRLATKRKLHGYPGRLTCIDKANVFSAFAFFREIFDERGEAFPDVECDYAYVDAASLRMVQAPWRFDVAVTENMFGDILSDLGAGLIGGLGMAPSADIGDDHAVFQPCHGTAPDIMGQGKANPTAMFLSAGMMLDWLAGRTGDRATVIGADAIQRAVDYAFEGGRLGPTELGGSDGTAAITEAVMAQVDRACDDAMASLDA